MAKTTKRQSIQQVYKNIKNDMHTGGLGNEIDYTTHIAWIMFLKYLDDDENNKKIAAQLSNKDYTPVLDKKYSWSSWAVAHNEDGTINQKLSLTGQDLLNFVNNDLLPYLRNMKDNKPKQAQAQKIGEIFQKVENKIISGAALRDILDKVDTLSFEDNEQIHQMSVLYEDSIKNMGSAGRNGGEYYTPRPLIKSIVRIINPQISEKVYDGACGSAGFLCEAYAYMKEQVKTPTDIEILQHNTFVGKDNQPVAYLIGNINMILHGVKTPDIRFENTLEEDIKQIANGRYDCILANPPFGAKNIRSTIQNNFPIRTGESSLLFLQHFIRVLKPNGRAGIIIKNTFLTDNSIAYCSIRKELFSKCNVFAILELPQNVFTAGVKAVVLFFTKGLPTKEILYYQLDIHLKKKQRPLTEEDLQEFENCIKENKCLSEFAWKVQTKDLNKETYYISTDNPNIKHDTEIITPHAILEELKQLNTENQQILNNFKNLLDNER